MIIGGSVMMFFGAGFIVAGILLNANEDARLSAVLKYGSLNPGLLPIILGALLLAGGIALLVLGILRGRKPPARQIPQTPVSKAPPAPIARAPETPKAPETPFRIQCLAGTYAGKRFPVPKTLTIGRDAAVCDLAFPVGTAGISRTHCRLRVDGGTVWLVDLGSVYGTFLEGSGRLNPNQPVRLGVGSRFWLGNESQVFIITLKGGM